MKTCWADPRDDAEESDATNQWLLERQPSAVCLLEEGHIGFHVWTPADEVKILGNFKLQKRHK